jgi:hypothetical protein
MFFVSGNTYVTLATVHASGSLGGLFAETPLDFRARDIGRLHLDGKPSRPFVRRQMPSFLLWRPEEIDVQSPLFTRA